MNSYAGNDLLYFFQEPESGLRDYPLTKLKLSNIDKSSVRSYTRGLLKNLFTNAYLKDHSPTGEKSNALPKEYKAKPALEAKRMKYMKRKLPLTRQTSILIDSTLEVDLG
ncbi:hypothetical protein QAD02_003551 [Eretmocerus hayati]|uniref:Uncharacterized protein n=1 Tax=Eretmocerus hayati TaxID=131215 RepID=A0ACC2NMH0_9HYME|nr:hypothetical protein QAD02_003551 [Eretmocerus hayati]